MGKFVVLIDLQEGGADSMPTIKSKRAFTGRIRRQIRTVLRHIASFEAYDTKEVAKATAAGRTAFRIRGWGSTSYVNEFNTVKAALNACLTRKTTDAAPGG